MVCGIGPSAAGKAAGLMLFQKIDCLISWGTAAALTEDVFMGDLIIPEYIHAESGDIYQTDDVCSCNLKKKINSGLVKMHTGLLAETGVVLENPAQKAELVRKTGAIAADMESAAIMQVAQKNSLPCIAVRTVVDESDNAVPAELTRHIDIFGEPDIPGIITEFLLRPRLIRNTYSLFRGMKIALKTLDMIAAEIDGSIMQAV